MEARTGISIGDQPFAFELPNGSTIAELPIAAEKWGPLTVRLVGGRALRLLPRGVSMRHLRACAEDGRVAMMYLHSYELPDMPMASYVPRTVGFKRLVISASALGFQAGLRRMEGIVRELLSAFRWSSAWEVLAATRASAPLPVVSVPVD